MRNNSGEDEGLEQILGLVGESRPEKSKGKGTENREKRPTVWRV